MHALRPESYVGQIARLEGGQNRNIGCISKVWETPDKMGIENASFVNLGRVRKARGSQSGTASKNLPIPPR